MIRSLMIKFMMLAGILGSLLAWGWPKSEVVENWPSSSKAVFSSPEVSSEEPADRKVENPADESLSSFGEGKASPPAGTIPPAKLVDLNRSSVKELEALPGIGPTLANRIVDYRNEIGGFSNIQALEQIKGIGPKKLKALSPLLQVSSHVVARKP